MIYDALIIGCGPAGMTAAIYAARAGKKTIIIDHEGVGGQMGKSPKIENFPGFQAISGSDLAFTMFDQVINLGVQMEIDEISDIQRSKNGFIIDTPSESYESKTLIVATGAHPIELDVPGGKEYSGNGVHYCVACDGPMFKNREVLVVGSGNSGAQYALDLNQYCSKVTICDVAPTLFCEKTMADQIMSSDIQLLLSKQIASISKQDEKMSVLFADGLQFSVDGIFVAIGQKPSTEVVKGLLRLDDRGYIISSGVDTEVPGVYVAGDCRQKKIRQAVTAASDGAEAALSAVRYLNNL